MSAEASSIYQIPFGPSALAPGARLGPYEILSALGAGGMGEVYRARDTKLNRDVALKILPDAFASDPDRLARFTREAQTLAALNHPVEASGATWSAGTPMKLLEGRYYTGTGSGRAYDVSPAGQRFLMIKAPGTDASAAPPPLIVVQHWDEELKRLVPTR